MGDDMQVDQVFTRRETDKRHEHMWHFDRTISATGIVNTIITVLATVATVLSVYYGLDKRIDREKDRAEFFVQIQHERDARQDEAIRDTATDIKSQLAMIQQSLIRLDDKLEKKTAK
jgi:hypothetical protein